MSSTQTYQMFVSGEIIILKCQSCKRNLTTALANAMLQTAAVIMLQNRRLIVAAAGRFTESNRDKAYMVTKNDDTLLPIEALETNMEEGDNYEGMDSL